jgi:hypothetical protein
MHPLIFYISFNQDIEIYCEPEKQSNGSPACVTALSLAGGYDTPEAAAPAGAGRNECG